MSPDTISAYLHTLVDEFIASRDWARYRYRKEIIAEEFTEWVNEREKPSPVVLKS